MGRSRGISICTVEGCERPVVGKALCALHYQRVARHGSTESLRHDPVNNPVQPCKIEGCNTLARTKGFCDRHYQQNRREHNEILLNLSDSMKARLVQAAESRGVTYQELAKQFIMRGLVFLERE